MTIKGPYIVAHSTDKTGPHFTAVEIRNVYNQKPRRVYLSNEAKSTEHLYVFFFTDDGTTVHHHFDIVNEMTYYRRAAKDAPVGQTFTQTQQYYVGKDKESSATLDSGTYDELGKQYWYFGLGKKTITQYLEDNGDTSKSITFVIPSLAVESTLGTYADSISGIENGNGWDYSGDNDPDKAGSGFDFISMKLSITPGVTYSGTNLDEFAVTDTLSIEARPDWTILAAKYLDLYTLEIDVSSSFGRTDDRWALEASSYVVQNELSLLRADEPWGILGGVRSFTTDEKSAFSAYSGEYMHVIYVDTTYFARVLGGRKCMFNMHFNHLWNDANKSTISASNEVTVEADGVCRPPQLAGSIEDFSVSIELSASGQTHEGNNEPQYAIVALDGAKFKEDIQLVTLDSNHNGKVAFSYPPLDKYVTFEAVGLYAGTDGVYHASTVRTYSLGIESHGNIILDNILNADRCMIKYHPSGSDMGPSISVKNDAVVEQLAGRRRPSVFYGESGTTDISFDGLLVDDEGDDFENIPEGGLCILRFPGGRRYAADVSVSISDSGNRLTSVSVSGSEVDF